MTPSRGTLAAVLFAVFAWLLLKALDVIGPRFSAGPVGYLLNSLLPPSDAVAVYANPDLGAGNKILEYLLPAFMDLGSMIRCPILRPDAECMRRGRYVPAFVREHAYAPVRLTHDEATHSVERKGGGEPLEIVLLTPKISEDPDVSSDPPLPPPPLVIWMHGGGFVIGEARDAYMVDLMTRMAAHGDDEEWGGDFRRAVWASVEYRLAPEHPYPAQLEDCVLAIEYLLKRHVLDDGTRLGGGGVHLAGASAGADLAAMAGLHALKSRLRVDSILADVPALPVQIRRDFGAGVLSVFDSASYRRNWYSRIPGVGWSEWFWGAYTGCPQQPTGEEGWDRPEACEKDAQYFVGGVTSAKEWRIAKSRNGGRLPPLLVVSAKGDIFKDGAQLLLGAYTAADPKATVSHVVASSSHGMAFAFDAEASTEVFNTWGPHVCLECAEGISVS